MSVEYATTAETAHAGSDYTPTGGTLTFAAGETSRDILIPVLDDAANEGREDLTLSLSNPGGGATPGATTATLGIDPSDGVLVLDGSRKPWAVLTDADGDRVTVRLAGKGGCLVAYQTDPDGDGRGALERIELAGDTSKAAVSMAVACRAGGDGAASIGGVSGSALKAFTAAHSDVVGDGIHLTGYLGRLQVRDVAADITLNGAASTAQAAVKLRARAITGSAITVAAPVRSLTAAGAVSGAMIDVAGDIGMVSAGSIRNTTLRATGAVGSFAVTGRVLAFADSHVTAGRFNTVVFASVATDNGGIRFGFEFHDRVGSLVVRNPKPQYDSAAGGTLTLAGDFEVRRV